VVEDELVRKFTEAEVLITPEALEAIRAMDDPLAFASKLLQESGKRNLFVIEKSFVQELCEIKEEAKIPLPVEVRRVSDFKPLAKEWAPDLRFIEKADVTGKSNCKGKVEDFVACFRDRLTRTRKLIESRGGEGIVPTNSLKGLAQGRELRVAGLISSKRPTKKGDLLVEIEDEEGIAKVWIGKGRNEKEKACFDAANKLLLDEVAAISGKWSDPFVIATEIIWPDVPIRAATTIEKPVSVAFLSDLHVGSKLFLEKEFGSFIQWLNGGVGGQDGRERAGRVKYLVIAGDVVDGIGIYPKQEKELVVRDIFEQYRICARFLEAVPDYIEIILAPGNHDAVRRAEPQPSLYGEVADALGKMGNVHLVGNPAIAEIEGLKTLIYHGTSLDSVIAALPGMSYARRSPWWN
jgi:DNA polymerase II small subunit